MRAVHQFHPACSTGDGITNGMFAARRILRRLGYASEIFCEHVPEELGSEVLHPSKFEDRPGDVFLYHHSLGYRNFQWVREIASHRVLVYHNITPDFLLPGAEIRDLSRLGRDQLARSPRLFEATIADSEENAGELAALGYRNLRVLPLLIDFERLAALVPTPEVIREHQDTVNVLFVGRIAQNKRQSDLIDAFAAYRRQWQPRARLILVGGCTSPQYLAEMEKKVRALGLDEHVVLTGKVTDEDLVAYYRIADVYVSLSEHEGFGIPLIEAMAFGVPVIAHASASVPWTVGPGGLLLHTREPEVVASTIDTVVRNAGLRRAMRRGAQRSVMRFQSSVVEHDLRTLLNDLEKREQPSRPAAVDTETPPGYWRIEGPFDSSYSLAIVNRNLALAFAASGLPTGLYSTEGYGDFAPDPAFLERNPEVRALADQGQAPFSQDVTLRFCYPPRTDGMLGLVRAIHTYGWEETGFPRRYVHWFNQRLDLVTVLSTEVKKILVDSGVRVPIAVVGAGIDHVPVATTENTPQPERDAEFRFLHVSSCFPRKAPDVLLEAWSRAFTSADSVRLVIKTFPNPHNDIEAQVAALREKHPQAAPIEVINEDIDEAALAHLYRTSHAYVGASRGEGFGMPLAEAMIHDLPVITTAWGGQMDFCDEETAWLVDYTFAHSGSHLAEGVSIWAEPDIGQLAERMREVWGASEDARRQRTQRARARVVSNFYWGNVARRTESAVRALSLMPQLNERLRVGWVTTWNTRCGIAEYTRYLVETLPHESALILANRTPDLLGEDEARVLRSWESGLAPAETMDEVFEQVMARKLDAVVIQYNFGFVTLPVLARLITRLRRHGVGVYCIFHATAEFMHENQWLSLGNIRDALARANRLFVHSLADLNRLKSYGLASNSALLLHGVRAPRAPHAVAGEAKVIASFGFLLPGKGLPQLIEAFASLATRHPQWKLRLVNALYPSPLSDEEHQRCRELITALGLDARIELVTDFLSEDEVLDRLADAALIAFPYQATKESSSAAVRLGIASGRPVAVTPLSIFDDVSDTVFRLPGIEPQQIAAGIEELVARPDLEERAGAMVAEWSRHRTWRSIGALLANIIESCSINERFDAAIGKIDWRVRQAPRIRSLAER